MTRRRILSCQCFVALGVDPDRHLFRDVVLRDFVTFEARGTGSTPRGLHTRADHGPDYVAGHDLEACLPGLGTYLFSQVIVARRSGLAGLNSRLSTQAPMPMPIPSTCWVFHLVSYSDPERKATLKIQKPWQLPASLRYKPVDTIMTFDSLPCSQSSKSSLLVKHIPYPV